MTRRDFTQLVWDPALEDDCRQLARLAVREDLDRYQDWTTLALIPPEVQGAARVVARQVGVIAGLAALPTLLDEMQTRITCQLHAADGDRVMPGKVVAELSGSVRDLLVAERPLLNLLGRLSGIATLTRTMVDRLEGTRARLYDTRKTALGWRRLEKYAVRCGGGRNHRTGLWDAVLIKDNHLAFAGLTDRPSEAVKRARAFVAEVPRSTDLPILIEIEVDSLDQLRDVLPAAPDIVLLDNFSLDELREAVRLRDQAGASVELEASGTVRLETVRDIAETGVDRISSGALTHSAISLDIGLDWMPRAEEKDEG